ncbi:MAG: hypothetical protein WCT25_01545 [Candidatus Paceibacterota bacterium]|jgi:hypothetical protein
MSTVKCRQALWYRESGSDNKDIKATRATLEKLFGGKMVDWRSDRLWSAVDLVRIRDIRLLGGDAFVGPSRLSLSGGEVLWEMGQHQTWIPLGIEVLCRLITESSLIPKEWQEAAQGQHASRIFFDGEILTTMNKERVSPFLAFVSDEWVVGTVPLSDPRLYFDKMAVVKSRLSHRLWSAFFPE